MMVTASPGDEPIGAAGGIRTSSLIAPLLTTLDSKGVVLEDRVDAYLTLTERLKGEEQQNLSQEICQCTSQLTRLFCVDVMNENSELSQAALQALGFCVFHQDISRSFSEEDSNTVIKALCNALLKTEDKSTCTRALWCLSKQNFTAKTIKAELHSILCAVEHSLVKTQFQSMTVEHEGVNVIIKLLDQVPDEMPSHASRWAKLIYPLTVHSAHKIRERSAFAIQLGLPALQAHRAEIIPTLISDLKAALVPEMVKLFAGRQELHVLRIWGYFVSILGKALHKGGSLINCLLGVVEQGFKHPSAQVKKASFSVWNILIDNFAMEPEILYNAKRLKVLMQPLKATSAKTESVAHAKLDTWWHLAQRLGTRLASNFDLVCVPLLETSLGIQCLPDSLQGPLTAGTNGSNKTMFGTPRTPQHRNGPVTMASPATPLLNLMPGTPGSKNPTFKSVQSRGVEMLARLLGQPDAAITSTVKSCDIKTEPLKHDLLSSHTVFMKVAPSILSIMKDVVTLSCQQKLGENISEDLLLSIWLSLVAHVRNMVELASKRDSVGVFNDFLRCLQYIVGSWPHVKGKLILKLLESVSQHIPMKVLGSPSYHSSCAGAMHGTPALILIQMLFTEHLSETISDERFFCVYETFIQAGMSTPNTILGFAQSVVKMLDDYVIHIESKEALWRLWNRLVNPLLEHVIQSNEVNQGDSLDHDFSGMYACLQFPAAWLLDETLSQGTLKTLLKTWAELYQAFSRCAALVTTAESNQCCEELASRILPIMDKNDKSPKFLESSIHMCQVMVDTLDFSAFTITHGSDPLTPSKWTNKKLRPLGNLHSVVKLLANRITDLHESNNSKFTTFTGMFAQASGANPTLTSAMSTAIGVVATLFTHTSQPGLISSMLAKFAKPLAVFYKRLAKLGVSTHVYNASIQQKLEKLWIDILTSVQTRYAGPYDSDFLATMSPLLEVTILHPKRTIKDHTLVFWNATFATRTSALEYPEQLKVVLTQVKEKTPIVLPGWSQSDNINIVNETPMSQLIESEASQSIMGPPASVIPNFGSPSPIKMHGSFLKRSAQAERLVASSSPDRMRGRSPGRFSSPDRGRLQSPNRKTPKRNQSPSVAAVRRKLPVDEDSMQFVAIAPSPTKKRVLTEHQKDVMRTKRTVIPGLYNDLEQSQDTQAFSDLYTQTQTQMEEGPTPAMEPVAPVDLNVEKQAETSPKKVPTPTNRSSPRKASVFNLKANSEDASSVRNDLDNESVVQEEPDKVHKPQTRDSNEVFEEEKTSSSGDETKLQDEIEHDENVDSTNQKDKCSENVSTSDEKHGDSNTADDCGMEEEKLVDSMDSKSQDDVQEEKKEHHDAMDETEVKTPPKNSNGIAKDTDNLLSQEVTPPKSSRSPIDRKVMVTPVIKLQKMSVQDILKYSPSAADSAFAKLDVDSSPKVFPSSKEKDAEKGRTRFRRYKSAEVRSSPRMKRSQGRTSSFDDMVIMETQSEDMLSRSQSTKKSLLGKQQQGLLTSQADLAELAERFELDGIEPLDDETDVNQSLNQADLPPVLDFETDAQSDLKNKDERSSEDVGKKSKIDDAGEKQSKETQEASSEESMEFIDTQEELIPDASTDKVEEVDTTADSPMETDSLSDYFTADNSSSEESVTVQTKDVSIATEGQQETDKDKRKKGVKKSKQKKPDFVLSTLEELTEPNSQRTVPDIEKGIDATSGDTVKDGDAQDDGRSSRDIASQESVKELSSVDLPKEMDTETSDESSQNSGPPAGKKQGRGRSRKAVSKDNEDKGNELKKSGHERSRKAETIQDSEKSADKILDKDSQSGDSTSQSGTESKQTKEKRGRGRPKKVRKGDQNSLDKSIKTGSQSEDNLSQSLSSEKSADKILDKDSQSGDSTSQSGDESKQTKEKRGRGRPKKVRKGDKNSLDKSIKTGSQSEDNLSQSLSSESQGTKKRGRGRPRKFPNSTENDSTSSKMDKDSSTKEQLDKRVDSEQIANKDQNDSYASENKTSTPEEVSSQGENAEGLKEVNDNKKTENSGSQAKRKMKENGGQLEKEGVTVATETLETADSKDNANQAEIGGNGEKSPSETQSPPESGHLDNSCEDMFGTYNPDALSEKASDIPQKDDEEENSVAMIEVKSSNKKQKKRRSFTKLSRRRKHSPCAWDDDDDVPLAKISHCYLDVEGQSSEDSDREIPQGKSTLKTCSSPSKSKPAEISPVKEKVTKVTDAPGEKSPGPTKRQRKSSRFALKKSPQTLVAKKVLRRALKSPSKKSPKMLSPVRRRSSTPISDKKRSPIATRLRAGNLTPRSARQLLAGKMSPKEFTKLHVEVKPEKIAQDEVDAIEAESMDDSFDMPLNQYIKKSKSPVEKINKRRRRKQTSQSAQEAATEKTTQEQEDKNSCNTEEESKNTKDQDSQCANDKVEELINSSQSPVKINVTTEPINKEVMSQDPKVGQSLQSLPHRLQYVTLTGRNSPTECLTPPENTSPVIPHKFSPRSSSSPVEFAMRRGANQGSPRQRASPVSCEIPGVFSPSVSPSSGILKRRDSPSPSPLNKSRRVSFAEPIEQEKSTQSMSPQSKHSPVTSSPSRSGIIAALLPSPLVTTSSSRVVSLQSKFITTPSKRASSTSKLKSLGSLERSKRRSKKQSLKVINTRMLFSRGARAIMASKQGAAENGGKKVSAQEEFEIAALDSMTRGIPVMLSPTSSPATTATPSPTTSTQETPALLTQGTQNVELDSSMEVDFESQEAVFPDLVDCQVPVDKVLHQLTSSMWVRGLEQLVRARNILTVGHLCSLSPGQVKSLPIRSPKVSTLCQVMERFKKRQMWKFDKTCSITSMDKETVQMFVERGQRSLKSLELAKLEKDVSSSSTTVLKKITRSEAQTSNEHATSKIDNSDAITVPESTSKEILLTAPVELQRDDKQMTKAPSLPSEDKQKAPSLHEETGRTEPEAKLDSNKTSVVENVNDESQPFSVCVSAESSSSNGVKIVTPKRKPPVPRCASKDDKPSPSFSMDQTSSDINKDNNNTISSRPGKRKRDDSSDESSDDASPSIHSSPKRKRMVDQLGDIAKELSGDALQSMSTDKLFQAHQHVNNLMDSIMAALKTKCRSPSLESS